MARAVALRAHKDQGGAARGWVYPPPLWTLEVVSIWLVLADCASVYLSLEAGARAGLADWAWGVRWLTDGLAKLGDGFRAWRGVRR